MFSFQGFNFLQKGPCQPPEYSLWLVNIDIPISLQIFFPFCGYIGSEPTHLVEGENG